MKRAFSEVANGVSGGQAPNSLVVTIRLLCRVDRSGSVIGKGGDVVKSIRNDTGARVKVEDVVPGEKERVITISSAPERSGAGCPAQEALQRMLVRMLEVEGPGSQTTPPEQAEVCLIVDSVYVGSIVGKGGSSVREMCSESGSTITVVGHVRSPHVGPQQQVIKVVGAYSGVRKACDLLLAKVRDCVQRGVQPPPSSAQGMQQQQQQHMMAPAGASGGAMMGPPMQQPRLMHQPSVQSLGPHMGGVQGMGHGLQGGMGMMMPVQAGGMQSTAMAGGAAAGMLGPGRSNVGAAGPGTTAGPYSYPVECVYRMLMPDSRVGALIGKAGEHLRRIRMQTGGEIQVDSKVEGAEERVVTCRSTEACDSQACGAAEALLRCVQFLVSREVAGAEGGSSGGAHSAGGAAHSTSQGGAAPGAGPVQHTIRIVTAHKQLGAVIGVKGATIRQLAADTKARLSVDKDKGHLNPHPLLAPTDELLLVEGQASHVMAALRPVAVLLRGIQVKHQADAKGLPIPPALATMLGCAPSPAPAAAQLQKLHSSNSMGMGAGMMPQQQQQGMMMMMGAGGSGVTAGAGVAPAAMMQPQSLMGYAGALRPPSMPQPPVPPPRKPAPPPTAPQGMAPNPAYGAGMQVNGTMQQQGMGQAGLYGGGVMAQPVNGAHTQAPAPAAQYPYQQQPQQSQAQTAPWYQSQQQQVVQPQQQQPGMMGAGQWQQGYGSVPVTPRSVGTGAGSNTASPTIAQPGHASLYQHQQQQPHSLYASAPTGSAATGNNMARGADAGGGTSGYGTGLSSNTAIAYTAYTGAGGGAYTYAGQQQQQPQQGVPGTYAATVSAGDGMFGGAAAGMYSNGVHVPATSQQQLVGNMSYAHMAQQQPQQQPQYGAVGLHMATSATTSQGQQGSWGQPVYGQLS